VSASLAQSVERESHSLRTFWNVYNLEVASSSLAGSIHMKVLDYFSVCECTHAMTNSKKVTQSLFTFGTSFLLTSDHLFRNVVPKRFVRKPSAS
jgi:HKD family nuclease